MKTRKGFVSNSSSSSFIIKKFDLSDAQISAILENDYKDQPWPEPWDIIETPDEIKGSTFMDNYDMSEFLQKIGVPEEKIKWDWPSWDELDA